MGLRMGRKDIQKDRWEDGRKDILLVFCCRPFGVGRLFPQNAEQRCSLPPVSVSVSVSDSDSDPDPDPDPEMANLWGNVSLTFG